MKDKTSSSFLFKKCLASSYWFIPFILFLAQALYTQRSCHQIRFEELSESVRNVWWLQNRTIYDGVSSNVGWYGILLVIYNIFGFQLHLAKFFRLFLHLISMMSLAAIFSKYLGKKKAWLLLFVIGLSPTLLFFNTLQTSYGIDLQFFPICLYLALSLNFSQPKISFLKQFFLWLLAMLSSMSYPSFIPYLLILAIIQGYKLKQQKNKLTFSLFFKNILFSLMGFCLPFILIFIYLKDPKLLLFDPKVQSGIFRGGGGGKLTFSFVQLISNIYGGIKQVGADVFSSASSYYFEPALVEFSSLATKISLIIILLISWWLFTKKKSERKIIFLSWLLITLSLVLTNLSNWFPGIRRSTPALAGFYSLYAVVLLFSFSSGRKNLFLKCLGLISCLLILIHHLGVFLPNLRSQSSFSIHKENACFNIFPVSPSKSLEVFINQVKTKNKLETVDLKGKPIDCRLHEIYAAVAGSCYWNRLGCGKIFGFDLKSKKYILLETELWEKYYLPH